MELGEHLYIGTFSLLHLMWDGFVIPNTLKVNALEILRVSKIILFFSKSFLIYIFALENETGHQGYTKKRKLLIIS